MDTFTKKQIEALRKKGFEVKRKVRTVKHTLEIPEDSLKAFFDIVHKREIKIKDAVAEMFEDYCEKHKPK